jgi:hypothetical protein
MASMNTLPEWEILLTPQNCLAADQKNMHDGSIKIALARLYCLAGFKHQRGAPSFPSKILTLRSSSGAR